jgi:hypothetical protein
VATFLAVALVVVVLVVASIAFGSRRGGRDDGNVAAGGTTALMETAATDTKITATAEAGPTVEVVMAAMAEGAAISRTLSEFALLVLGRAYACFTSTSVSVSFGPLVAISLTSPNPGA